MGSGEYVSMSLMLAFLIVFLLGAALVTAFTTGFAAAVAVALVAVIGVPLLGYKMGNRKIQTIIEVTPDAVIVNGNRLRRSDFGGFRIDHNSKVADAVVIGFSYGSTKAPIGGIWPEREATEFLSALNSHLRVTARAGDDTQVSPETLRAARPTEF
jgi:hypothetical protein